MKMVDTALRLTAFAALVAPLAVLADTGEVQGRTGLPTVKVGGDRIWMETGKVQLVVRGGDIVTTQEFRLRCPRPPLEKGPVDIDVAVREDYFRDKGDGGALRESEARGFRAFNVAVDGRQVRSHVDPWQINEKQDTATRWRYWSMRFRPGQVRYLRIVSRAPLGRQGGRRTVEFVSKDLGHWRTSPDMLEVRMTAPGPIEARLAGLEPKPVDVNRRAIRWVYRKGNPGRDIFVLLPADYQP